MAFVSGIVIECNSTASKTFVFCQMQYHLFTQFTVIDTSIGFINTKSWLSNTVSNRICQIQYKDIEIVNLYLKSFIRNHIAQLYLYSVLQTYIVYFRYQMGKHLSRQLARDMCFSRDITVVSFVLELL